MTPLRQRMQDAMVQRGFAASTQESYISAIYRMAKHYRRDPASYTAQDVQLKFDTSPAIFRPLADFI